jgi:hypothetical protein
MFSPTPDAYKHFHCRCHFPPSNLRLPLLPQEVDKDEGKGKKEKLKGKKKKARSHFVGCVFVFLLFEKRSQCGQGDAPQSAAPPLQPPASGAQRRGQSNIWGGTKT